MARSFPAARACLRHREVAEARKRCCFVVPSSAAVIHTRLLSLTALVPKSARSRSTATAGMANRLRMTFCKAGSKPRVVRGDPCQVRRHTRYAHWRLYEHPEHPDECRVVRCCRVIRGEKAEPGSANRSSFDEVAEAIEAIADAPGGLAAAHLAGIGSRPIVRTKGTKRFHYGVVYFPARWRW
jgi:hypothetical protein